MKLALPQSFQRREPRPDPAGSSPRADIRPLMRFFYFAIVTSLVLTFYGAASSTSASGINALLFFTEKIKVTAGATAVVWATACLAAGSCVGFLFGIPKILQTGGGDSGPAPANGAPARAANDSSYRQQVNTNLTEISDWLTKIIVGLGLINLNQIPGFIRSKAAVLASSLKSFDATGDYQAFSVGVMVAFPAFGFLFGYLSTRLYLAGMFALADRDATSSTQIQADATSGMVESLKEEVGVLAKKLDDVCEQPPAEPPAAPPRPAEAGAAAVAQGQTEPTSESPTSRSRIPFDVLLPRLAEEYNKFQSDDKAERVRVRNDLASRMAAAINSNPEARRWLAETLGKNRNVGLLAGLATAISASPQPGDLQLLLPLADNVPYKHTRYKIAAAIGRVFDSRVAAVSDIARVKKVLLDYYRNDTDDSLQNRVRQTLAQIAQSTGENTTL